MRRNTAARISFHQNLFMLISIAMRRALPNVSVATLTLAVSIACQAAQVVPASACQPMMNAKGTPDVFVNQYGLTTYGEDILVVCPVVRTQSARNLSVTVYGSVQPGATLTCTLHSNYADNASVNGGSFSVVGSASGSSKFSRTLYLDADDAPAESFQTVVCQLPGNIKAKIRGLMVNG